MENLFPTIRKVFIVIYTSKGMRERQFTDEKEANEFAITVNGSVCTMSVKTIPVSKKANKELKRIKTFGY